MSDPPEVAEQKRGGKVGEEEGEANSEQQRKAAETLGSSGSLSALSVFSDLAFAQKQLQYCDLRSYTKLFPS